LPVLGANFNHQILMIELPDGAVFVDPTSRTSAFADLPAVDEDRQVLPVTAKGSPLVDAPRSDPAKDMVDERHELVLGDDGRARGAFSATFSGEHADDLRSYLLSAPKDRHDDAVEELVALWAPKVEKLTLTGAPPPEESAPVVAAGTLSIDLLRGGISRADVGGGVLLRASRLFGAALPAVDEDGKDGKDRVGPFYLGHRRTKKATVTLTLPKVLRAARLPEESVLEGKHATFRGRWSADADGKTLTYERVIVIKERIVPAADVADLRHFIEDALAAEEEPVVLVGTEGAS
jgi:hypothetical protein